MKHCIDYISISDVSFAFNNVVNDIMIGFLNLLVQYNLSTPAEHGTDWNGRISQHPEYRRSSNLPQIKEVEYVLDIMYLFHPFSFSKCSFQRSLIDNYMSLVKQLLFTYIWISKCNIHTEII